MREDADGDEEADAQLQVQYNTPDNRQSVSRSLAGTFASSLRASSIRTGAAKSQSGMLSRLCGMSQAKLDPTHKECVSDMGSVYHPIPCRICSRLTLMH